MKTFKHIDCKTCDKREQSVFCNTCADGLEEISNAKSCTVYKKGQVLFNEGGHPLGVYCIHSGKIKLSIVGEEGRDQIVRLAKDGDVLGYRSLLASERYSATATALEESEVCFIPRENFMTTLKIDGNLSFEMMKLLSRQLHEAEVKLTHLAQKPVRERVAENLLFLKETFGFEEGTQVINVQLSREELANMVGTATETIIRLLSELNKDKIIELEGRKIRILDIKLLTKVANLID